MPNRISHPNQMDEPISKFRVDVQYLLFLVEIVNIQIRRYILRRLIWVCIDYPCLIKRVLGIYLLLLIHCLLLLPLSVGVLCLVLVLLCCT